MSDDHEWCRDVSRDEAVRAAEDAAAVPAIQHRDLPEVVADLRERVARLEAAEATIGSGDVFADVGCGSTGDEIARLTAERDAAIRMMRRVAARVAELEAERDAAKEECGRLRHLLKTKESECETHHPWVHPSAAPAANAGGEQQPPRGWLTKEEREAVDAAADAIGDRIDAYKEQDGDRRRIEVLDGLLARETPPKVKVPRELMLCEARGVRIVYDAGEVKRAIRAAGGEVEG